MLRKESDSRSPGNTRACFEAFTGRQCSAKLWGHLVACNHNANISVLLPFCVKGVAAIF